MENIIIALITAGIPALITLITNHQTKKDNRMHSARQSILQLIMEDNIKVAQGKIPENYQAICSEFDSYTKNGGNSYIHEKVEDYFNWYKELNK